MTVYGVIANGETICLYKSPVDACNHAHYLADKKEKELRQKIENGEDITVKRKDDRITLIDNEDRDYDEVLNYWVKSIDVLNKFNS